jgi:hypothetical protein
VNLARVLVVALGATVIGVGAFAARSLHTAHAQFEGDEAAPPVRAPRELGRFAERDIEESSGVTRDADDPREVYWTLNDSGNEPELFAFDSAGRDLGRVRLDGVRNRDWEAIAAGPCPEGRCLYVGDVGDNDAKHDHVDLWRVPVPADAKAVKAVRPTGHVRLTWQGGARDVEAMWLAADTSLWFATKRPIRRADGSVRPSLVHRVPASAWREGAYEAAVTDSLPIVPTAIPGQVVDAAFAIVDGVPRLAVATYVGVHVFEAGPDGRPGKRLAECGLAPFGIRQGEGVTWRPSGALLFTAEGKREPLWEGYCP